MPAFGRREAPAQLPPLSHPMRVELALLSHEDDYNHIADLIRSTPIQAARPAQHTRSLSLESFHEAARALNGFEAIQREHKRRSLRDRFLGR
jgi:hypothetical protein